MVGTGGSGHIPMTRLQSQHHRTPYHAVTMPPTIQTITASPSCWERLQCCVFGQTDNMDLVNATIEGKYQDCKRILEEGNTNINAQDEKTKQTALHYAAKLGKPKYVKLLLEYNANCNAQDSLGNTPLHLTIQNGHQECSKIILECDNLQINIANEAQDTPLDLAARKGYMEIVDQLLDKKADYNNVLDNSGNTLLHLTAESGHLNCCRKILQLNVKKIDAKNNNENTPLHLAAKTGESDIVALLKDYHANCNLKNSFGDTPLHLAVTRGHFNCFTKLMEYDRLEIDLTNSDYSTPLHCAAKTGNSEIVGQLLDRGAKCNAKDSSGNTPLHLTVTKGHYSCCEKLLGHSDLKVNDKNHAHETPLHVAARVGRKNMCHLILQYSGVADINIKNKVHMTPLHLAAQQNNDEVIELLLDKGANWKWRDKYAYMPLHYAAEKGSEKSCEHLMNAFKKDKNSKSLKLTLRNMKTPLMLAARGGNHRCCKKLFLDNINDQDDCGNTALFYAVEGDFLKTVSFLLDNNAKTNIKNKAGRTVLHQAAKKRADACLLYLLQNPNTRDLMCVKDAENSLTPFHEAINNEALTCAEILLNHGASLTDTCKDGMTPLHLAAKQGDPGICSLLVTYDEIDVNKENDRQETPLHVAAMYGCKDACKILMRKGTRVLATDKDGRTALHLAADRGHDQVVVFLIKKGLSPHVKDDDGSTALHLAATKGHLKSCQILLANAKRLILDVDNEKKLSVDRAFENKHDEVFAFLIRKLKPNKEIMNPAPQSPQHRNMLQNEERRKRFHKYMHQSLKPENHEDQPRVIAAEAIIESEWWKAAFFPEVNTDTEGKDQYCTNFHDLVNNHPSLALKAQKSCFQCPGATYDFRLFEDNFCHEDQKIQQSNMPSLMDKGY